MPDRTGTLAVSRPSAASSVLQSFRILVDGQEVGRVRSGGRLQVEVPAGRRRVEARIDWTGSAPLDVDVAAGAVTSVRCEPAPYLQGLAGIFTRPREHLRLSLE